MNIGKISELISNATCFEMIHENRWLDGVVRYPHCDSDHVKKNGHDMVQTDCQHYQCKHCERYFDDLTNTVFAGHHQPLEVWVSGEVEFDKVYTIAGYKGHPEALKKSVAPSPKEKVKRGSGQGSPRKRQAFRSGNDSARRSDHYQYDNVRKATIKPFITKHVAKGTRTYTDEYSIYNSLEDRGYRHKSVCHGKGEYARDTTTMVFMKCM